MNTLRVATPWSDRLGLTVPVANAPMGGVAGGRLAAAVSIAGGLGMMGVGSTGSVDLIKREVPYVEVTGLPFGIGLIDWVLEKEPALLDATLAASPQLVSVSFGDQWGWVEQVHSAGVLAATQVATVVEARAAQDAGVDVLVARGAEGGGHGDPQIGTLPLLEGVLESVSVPVLAAGGISSPRGLAAVLAAGASGAWLGTAFAACSESLASDVARRTLLQARETETIVTREFDVLLGYRWPHRFPQRVVRNEHSASWSGREQELFADPEARTPLLDRNGDSSMASVDAGQGVGILTAVQSAASVVDWLSTGAADLLGRWA